MYSKQNGLRGFAEKGSRGTIAGLLLERIGFNGVDFWFSFLNEKYYRVCLYQN